MRVLFYAEWSADREFVLSNNGRHIKIEYKDKSNHEFFYIDVKSLDNLSSLVEKYQKTVNGYFMLDSIDAINSHNLGIKELPKEIEGVSMYITLDSIGW